MTTLDHVALVLVAASNVFNIMRIRAIGSHEQAHCLQLGELQHVVALTAEHFADMTPGPLPEPVAEFVAHARSTD